MEAKQVFDQKPEIFVLGNGASLKNFDLKSLGTDRITIGCCLAYREWERIDWYPTFYVNVDNVVLKHQEKDIRKLIEDPWVVGSPVQQIRTERRRARIAFS